MRSEMLTTDKVLEVFTDELAARQGKVTDTFNDGRRLFCRSTLPQADQVRPGDGFHAGIALKATDEQICVYPYTFRLVCRNGAVRAQSVGSLVIEGVCELAPCSVLQSIREGIEACAAPEVFSDTMNRMRRATETQIDNVLNLLPMLSIFSQAGRTDLMSQILNVFFKEKNQTQYSFANAITAIARDTSDPQERWDLEELGGGLLVAIAPKPPHDSARAKPSRAAALSIA
jgi:hypothetical protein